MIDIFRRVGEMLQFVRCSIHRQEVSVVRVANSISKVAEIYGDWNQTTSGRGVRAV
jgi:hypothetical protein